MQWWLALGGTAGGGVNRLRTGGPLMLLACLAVSCAAGDDPRPPRDAAPEEPVVSADEVEGVRRQLDWVDREAQRESIKRLNALGERKVFAALEIILAKPKKDTEIADVFTTLRLLKGDR